MYGRFLLKHPVCVIVFNFNYVISISLGFIYNIVFVFCILRLKYKLLLFGSGSLVIFRVQEQINHTIPF
jgi:hypothetical protein